jgi:putative ABC transport system substrate-binding protein
MKRRTVSRALFYGALAPLVDHAFAQSRTTATVGFLHAASPQADRLAAFQRGLKESGFAEATNVRTEYRWADGRFERLPELAQELARQRVDVIATPGNTAAALAAKAATSTIPIVFGVAEDPVALGLVTSLARPGGNATGINYLAAQIVAKRLSLLRELLPRAVRVAALINPANLTNTELTLRELRTAGRVLGLDVSVYNASTADEIDSAFSAMVKQRPDGLFVAPDSYYSTRGGQLIRLAAKHGIPAVYSVRDYVEEGGLMSYGPNIRDMFYRVGMCTGKVLNGRNPAELPVEQIDKVELVINDKAAKALGLKIPPSLAVGADYVSR